MNVFTVERKPLFGMLISTLMIIALKDKELSMNVTAHTAERGSHIRSPSPMKSVSEVSCYDKELIKDADN